jgi:hypothetical protein
MLNLKSLIAHQKFKFNPNIFFSTKSSIKPDIKKIEKVSNWVRPTRPEDVSIIGKHYNSILFKGRLNRPVGLADLRNLLQLCIKPEHVKFAVKIIDYYQSKGMDFAEDINSLFIKACINGGDPKAASTLILKVI